MKHFIIAAAIITTIFCAARSYAYDDWFDRPHTDGYGSFYGKSYPSGGYGDFGTNREYDYYSPAPQRNYSHGGEIYLQNGYWRSNGTYVMPYYKTRPDNYKWNNLGEWGR